jgi:hypothetical protein
MWWSIGTLLLGLVLGLVGGFRLGWRLATRSVELMKRAQDQKPELRTMCGLHDAYLDIAEEIERSTSLPPAHTLKRIGSYVRNQIQQLCAETEKLSLKCTDSFLTSTKSR